MTITHITPREAELEAKVKQLEAEIERLKAQADSADLRDALEISAYYHGTEVLAGRREVGPWIWVSYNGTTEDRSRAVREAVLAVAAGDWEEQMSKNYENKDLRNRLSEMQQSPYYAPACHTLVKAEQAIVNLENENNKLRAKLEALEKQEPVMMGVMATRDGSLMEKVAVKGWFTFPKKLAELEANLWVFKGAAKIVPLYLAAGAKAMTQEVLKQALEASVDSISKFIASQEPLGSEFAKVLHDNLDELYETDANAGTNGDKFHALPKVMLYKQE